MAGVVLLAALTSLPSAPAAAGHADYASGPHGGSEADLGGAIYVMTNAADGNEILTFARDRQGRLHPLPGATVATGGVGGSVTAPVDPLGSQNSLLHDPMLDLLFAVNAGDDSVTVFSTRRGLRPHRTHRVASGGSIPVSVAVSDDRLYVLNAGGSGIVSTFAISRRGRLELIGSLDLGLANGTSLPFDQVMAPGQVGVDALARQLIVVNAGGQELLVAWLDDDGVPMGPLTSTATPAPVPFAFDITRHGTLVLAEASGSVSAFDPPAGDGTLAVSAAAVPSSQAATCWVIVHDAGFAYASNTGSNTLGLYQVSRTGHLEITDPAAAGTGAAPTDLTFANGQGFLYSLDAGSGEISGFRVDPGTGKLKLVETQSGLPASLGIQGIAARDR